MLWLITPFPNPIDDVQNASNRALKKERVIIEHTFDGQLKQRFPILKCVYSVKLKKKKKKRMMPVPI